jgi:hypothetical protein
MDTLLIAVAVLSLAIASAMSLVVLKLLREDRRRSEARIAALLEAARLPEAGHKAPPYNGGRAALHAPPRHADGVHAAPHEGARSRGGRAGLHAPPHQADGVHAAPHEGTPARGGRAGLYAPPRAGDLPLRTAPPTGGLFAEPEQRASWGPRIALAAGAMALLLGVGFTMLGRDAAVPAAPGAAAAAAPLELLTLRHTAGAGSLTVSGLVQNPRGGGAALRRVAAVVYALDANGEVLATSRAPIDLTTFGPGEESPFVVTVPVGGAVARYRVGFRADGGEVIAHVDRRAGAEALAHR